jgi:hypothetical protein
MIKLCSTALIIMLVASLVLGCQSGKSRNDDFRTAKSVKSVETQQKN